MLVAGSVRSQIGSGRAEAGGDTLPNDTVARVRFGPVAPL
jgi:hypothetical protein